jgi:hypothetical protein
VVTLGFLKKKGSRKNAPNPRRGLVVFPVLLQALPDPNVRLKFEKLPLDLSAIRQCGRLTYRRSERIGGTVAAFAWRAEL